MTNKVCFFVLILSLSTSVIAQSNLIQLFESAVQSDPTYLQVVEKTLAIDQNIPINFASLLPNLSLVVAPQRSEMIVAGAATNSHIYPPISTVNQFGMELSLSQTIFNLNQWTGLKNARLTVRQAHASLCAASQDLMFRLAQAYFKVLLDEENLNYYQANKAFYARQLSDAKKMYQLGSRSITDVYVSESAYSTAESNVITAKTALAVDKEFLSTITGEETTTLAKLRPQFKMVSPEPKNMVSWVSKAKEQNWTIKANIFAAEAARERVKQSNANHLPTVTLNAKNQRYWTDSTGRSLFVAPGQSRYDYFVGALSLNVPLFSGGLVVAQTRQALHRYKVAQQNLEASFRTIIYRTRQSFLSLLSDLQKISSDEAAIKSTRRSVFDMQERYNQGSGTMVDVLNEQEKWLRATSQYAADRHSYIINFLSLKNAAGTLCVEDLVAINAWLD